MTISLLSFVIYAIDFIYTAEREMEFDNGLGNIRFDSILKVIMPNSARFSIAFLHEFYM